jgi:streptogramin lyase
MLAALLSVLALAAPQVIATGNGPCGAAAGFGSVWVANDRSGTLVRIDPRSSRVVGRVRVGRGACSTATGAGAVWVVNYATDSLFRIDPRTLRVRTVRVGDQPESVLVAFGRVWLTAWVDGTLEAVEPATLSIVRRIDVGHWPAGLAARRGSIWVGFGRQETAIARVDPLTAAVTRIPVGAARPAWFVSGAPDLWIQTTDSDLLHVDPADGTVLGRHHIGRTLGHGATAPDGTIWVPDKEQSIVYRIDPKRGTVVESFPAGRGAFLALRAFGSMWVISYAGSDVWRFAPARRRP